MREKILAIAMATAITATAAVPAMACTPQYKPVSKQPWYKSLQSALDAAYESGEEAGKEAVKDIEFHFDFSGIDPGQIDFSKIVLK